MNHNLWYVDNAAMYEQRRILEDVRQIRLEQQAMMAAHAKSLSSEAHPTGWRAIKHAALVVAQAIMALFA
jgi:hypothetical protein